jgi:sec-independent protein translocase protein TatA
MIGWTSPTHLVLLMLIALCLFGAKRLPEIGRSLGSGMREFKESVTHQAIPETTEREKVD